MLETKKDLTEDTGQEQERQDTNPEKQTDQAAQISVYLSALYLYNHVFLYFVRCNVLSLAYSICTCVSVLLC